MITDMVDTVGDEDAVAAAIDVKENGRVIDELIILSHATTVNRLFSSSLAGLS